MCTEKSGDPINDRVFDHMMISWYVNTIENLLLQTYASDPAKLPEAVDILHHMIDLLRPIGTEPEVTPSPTGPGLLPKPCKGIGWIRCADGLCYPGKCPPSSGPESQE
jgi:hypothetical protein